MTRDHIDEKNQYTRMQQQRYDNLAKDDVETFVVTGPFSGPFIGLNSYVDYVTYLWKDIQDLKNKDVLDFGCGPGRNLVFYAGRFRSIDGVDISQENLNIARSWIEGFTNLDINKFKLFKNNGVDLNAISDESYDVVMSVAVMQHIAVYDIRYQLLKEFYRVLRPGGYVTLQFLLTAPNKPGTVKYYDNSYDSKDTNGANDCVVENAEFVIKDLEEIGFKNVNHYVRPAAVLPGTRRNPNSDVDWLFINAQKQG